MSLIYNIGQLAGIQPEGVLRVEGAAQGRTGQLENAWLRIENGRIAALGPMATCPLSEAKAPVDAAGGMLMPGFCDSHTHANSWTKLAAGATRKSRRGAAVS